MSIVLIEDSGQQVPVVPYTAMAVTRFRLFFQIDLECAVQT